MLLDFSEAKLAAFLKFRLCEVIYEECKATLTGGYIYLSGLRVKTVRNRFMIRKAEVQDNVQIRVQSRQL